MDYVSRLMLSLRRQCSKAPTWPWVRAFSYSPPIRGAERPHSPKRADRPGPTPQEILDHRKKMKEKFPDGWAPTRKLSREAMEGLRTMHAHNPELFTTSMLATRFKISPEAVRRILKSKWVPSREREAEMMARDREQRKQWIQSRIDEERKQQAAQDEDVDERDQLSFR